MLMMIITMSQKDQIRMTIVGLLICALTLPVISTQSTLREFPNLDEIKPKASSADQEAAVKDLVKRLLPNRANEFVMVVDPALHVTHGDAFLVVSNIDGTVRVTGNTGVTTAMGLFHYLKTYAGCHVSWSADQLELPAKLPLVPQPGDYIILNDKFRYYMNVCTQSYSYVWWDWERWEREIDWMALQGINLPLAFLGQEAIWKRVYLRMGFKQAELDAHFAGPAFLAWGRMGNMKGWGGPLPDDWYLDQLNLQHRILDRMRQFGMIPVLPAFAGHVPDAITRVFPNVKSTKLPNWNGFNSTYCCTVLLDVTDPVFTKIGAAFINEMIGEFGTDHIYNTDTFNENNPPESDPVYIQRAGSAVFKAITAADSKAIWLMQGWLFLNSFWGSLQAEALLTSVPKGRMIVLDLMAEEYPQYERLKSFYGQPFIWCMLHNFGGTDGLYGDLPSANENPFIARYNSTMVGVGLTPEGINQNDFIYEFMMENTWRHKPRNISSWAGDYAKRRYHTNSTAAQNAWQYLAKSVYNDFNKGKWHGHYIMVRRPNLKLPHHKWYRPSDLKFAWKYMLEDGDKLKHMSGFRYDLVDVTREGLQEAFVPMYDRLVAAFYIKNISAVNVTSAAMLELLSDMELILSSDKHFLLGVWLESAKSQGHSEKDKSLYEFNARNQITLWGPYGEIRDYAQKQWSGIFKNYYFKRWDLFTNYLKESLIKGVPYKQRTYQEDVFKSVERPFSYDRSLYPTTPQGDPVQISRHLYTKYSSYLDDDVLPVQKQSAVKDIWPHDEIFHRYNIE